jgi:hypothetical protein
MLAGLRSLWESTSPDTCGHILTEGGDFLITEGGDRLVTECFVPVPIPVQEQVSGQGPSGFAFGGRPVYIKPKKTKPWPSDGSEEEEIEELLAMMGIDL